MNPTPTPKNSPCGSQKIKNDPKIKLKSNIRIDKNIQNESFSITWVDPKTVFEPFCNPKNSQLGLQKVENYPKIKSNTNVKIEKEKKMKLFNYMSRPKNCCGTLLQTPN